MAIDLLEKDRVNIKNLVLPEPNLKTRGLPFSPERDITAKDEAEIKKHLGEQMNEMLNLQRLEGILPSATHFFEYYLATKVLCPQVAEKLPFDESLWSAISDRLTRSRNLAQPDYFDLSAILKLTFPGQEITGLKSLPVDEKVLNDTLITPLTGGEYESLLKKMWNYKVLFPQSFPQSYLNDSVWQKVEDYSESLYQHSDWESFAQTAARSRIIHPEHFKKIRISGEDWKKMRESLIDFYRKSGVWHYFTVNAMNLTILAVEDVQVTDQGLEITMPKQTLLTEAKPKLPQRRKF